MIKLGMLLRQDSCFWLAMCLWHIAEGSTGPLPIAQLERALLTTILAPTNNGTEPVALRVSRTRLSKLSGQASRLSA